MGGVTLLLLLLLQTSDKSDADGKPSEDAEGDGEVRATFTYLFSEQCSFSRLYFYARPLQGAMF